MPETNRLGYSRGVLDQLRASHENLSQEELLDLVCHLTKTYVLDRTLPFALPHAEREQELRHDDRPDAPLTRAEVAAEDDSAGTTAQRFARLIENLKQRTGLPQFQSFETDPERAVLIVDNQKITFGERVTVEFVPRKGTGRLQVGGAPAASSAPAPARRTPGAPEEPPPAARPTPKATTPKPNLPMPSAAPPPSAEGDDGFDPSVERFRRLDLD